MDLVASSRSPGSILSTLHIAESSGGGDRKPLPLVLFALPAFRDNRPMDPSPGPWAFHTHVYGLANVLLDRDGRVISCHLPTGNGALIAEAPAMADPLCDLLAGVPTEQLRSRAASIMRQIERHHTREPGEDDE